MPVIKFGPWLPDFGALVTGGGVTRALNILPAPDGYDPVRVHSPSTAPVETRPLGAFAALSTDLATYQYCGTVDKLFLNIGGTWTNRSRSVGGPYASTPNGFWDFAQWGKQIIATNGFDAPQISTLGSVAGFANLSMAGWPFIAKFCTVIRNHLVMANLIDTSDPGLDTLRPSRVKWSGFNNETQWVPDLSTLSDYEDLKTSKIVRIFGGEYGVIFQPASIWKMTYVGSPAAFQFDEIASEVGLIAPGAAVQVGDTIFFWSQKGFYALTAGQKLTPIGANKVDQFAATDVDKGYTHHIYAAADPKSQQIHFLYPGAGSLGGEPNRRFVFDTSTGNWSLVIERLAFIWTTAGTAADLDYQQPLLPAAPLPIPGDPYDLDAPDPVSFDDPRWIGDAWGLAAFDSTFRGGFFDGANMRAQIETAEYAFNPNGRARLQGFRPLVEMLGGQLTAEVGTRNSQSESVVWGPILNTSRDNRIYTRTNARYHRIRFNMTGEWDHAMGWEMEDRDMKIGEGRG